MSFVASCEAFSIDAAWRAGGADQISLVASPRRVSTSGSVDRAGGRPMMAQSILRVFCGSQAAGLLHDPANNSRRLRGGVSFHFGTVIWRLS
jgi:hypothetical protein